jgi:hypothetical protein
VDSPDRLLPETDVVPIDETSLLLLSLLDLLVPFGDEDDFDDNFLVPTAINATRAQDPTTIIATFLELVLTFVGVTALPFVVLSLSDSTVLLPVVLLLFAGSKTGDDIGDVTGVGIVAFGTEVGVVKIGLDVSR